MRFFFSAATDLGDAALTGMFSLVFAAYLFIVREKPAALAVLTAFLAAGLAVGLSKIALYSRCQPSAFPLSPSGHSALAIAVYGTAAIVISRSQPQAVRRAAIYAFTALALAAIVVSRSILGFHKPGDVVVGAGIGLLTLLGVWYAFLKGRTIRCRWRPFAVIGLTALGFLYGTHVPAEDMAAHISAFLRSYVNICR